MILVHATFDPTSNAWRVQASKGSNLISARHLEVLINRDLFPGEKHFLLRLSHKRGGHRVRYTVKEASDGKSITLHAFYYPSKNFTVSGSFATVVKSVMFKDTFYVEALSVAEDGKTLMRAAPLHTPKAEFVPPPTCLLQPSLPGLP